MDVRIYTLSFFVFWLGPFAMPPTSLPPRTAASLSAPLDMQCHTNISVQFFFINNFQVLHGCNLSAHRAHSATRLRLVGHIFGHAFQIKQLRLSEGNYIYIIVFSSHRFLLMFMFSRTNSAARKVFERHSIGKCTLPSKRSTILQQTVDITDVTVCVRV